jgi:DNA (cytosine-5)-methyltransferase 1
MRLGSLFTGYGGLDLAALGHYSAGLAWVAEIDAAACRILAAHHPGVPNLGDVSRVDWTDVEPVDVLTAGYPCQPFSHAGKREGTNDDRHLWPYVADAARVLRPRRIVLENVAGHLSLGMVDVLGDLTRLGYGARWGTVRASDAGAAHGRARVFIVAQPADPDRRRRYEDEQQPRDVGQTTREGKSGIANGHSADGPTPDPGSARLEGRRATAEALHATGPARTPADDRAHGEPVEWGQYADAVERWARVLGRPAPTPTVPGVNGRPRLSPVFVEWLMGLPAGWVTGHGLRPARELAALGNGVVPQQAALALALLDPTGADR